MRSIEASIKFRWECQSGSELFVAYNVQQDTLGTWFLEAKNLALNVKINRLFRL